jgi:hypothetical protein
VPVDPAQPWRVESDLARLDLDLQSHRPSLLDRSSHYLTSQPTNEDAWHGQGDGGDQPHPHPLLRAGRGTGLPVRLVHDSLTTGRFWQDVADGYRRISTADGLVA